MTVTKTSETDPLRIDSVAVPGARGRIGMTLCPGKTQRAARSGAWARDIAIDLDCIKAFGAAALVTLMEEAELAAHAVPVDRLRTACRDRGIEGHHLPIVDVGVPDNGFEDRWSYSGTRLRRLLWQGDSIVLHCLGGLGRTGTIAARLLVEFGAAPDAAIHAVRAARHGAIETVPQEAYVRRRRPLPPITDTPSLGERTLGLLLGGAVGDAFGYAVEFDSLQRIRARFGGDGIREPVLHAGRAIVSDDTQMSMFTLEALLDMPPADNASDAERPRDRIRDAYLDWYQTQAGPTSSRRLAGQLALDPALQVRRAPGTTCLSALGQGGNGRIDSPINDSKGCGGVMRVAPIGLFPERYDAEACFALAAEAAALTHGHPSGYLSAGVLAAIIRLLVDGIDLVDAAHRAVALLAGWSGRQETAMAVGHALTLAAGRPTDHTAAVRSLGAGWVGEEALAIGLYAALVASSFADALVIAANHDGDSDSTASIASQIWGAWHGLDGIPHEWVLALDVLEPLLRLARTRQEQLNDLTPGSPGGQS